MLLEDPEAGGRIILPPASPEDTATLKQLLEDRDQSLQDFLDEENIDMASFENLIPDIFKFPNEAAR